MIRDGWMQFFSSSYLCIIHTSPIAMDSDASRHQRRILLKMMFLLRLYCVNCSRADPLTPPPPTPPTAFRPRGKHLPLRCVRIMTSNHYGAVMSWARSVAASLERQCASFLIWSSRVSRARMAGGEGGEGGQGYKRVWGGGGGALQTALLLRWLKFRTQPRLLTATCGQPGALQPGVLSQSCLPVGRTKKFQCRKFANAHGNSPSL